MKKYLCALSILMVSHVCFSGAVWATEKIDRIKIIQLLNDGESNSDLFYLLSVSYLYGIDGEVNHSESFNYATRAAAFDSDRARLLLSHHYIFGVGVNVDEEKAVHLLKEAAKNDYPPALENLGIMTAQGRGGLIQDYSEAYSLLEAAFRLGRESALVNIAVLYNRLGDRIGEYAIYSYAKEKSIEFIPDRFIYLDRVLTQEEKKKSLFFLGSSFFLEGKDL